MLGRRRRRRGSIKTTLAQRLVVRSHKPSLVLFGPALRLYTRRECIPRVKIYYPWPYNIFFTHSDSISHWYKFPAAIYWNGMGLVFYCIDHHLFLTSWVKSVIYRKLQTLNNKHKMLNQCLINVGPTSKTVGQHYLNIGSSSCACWLVKYSYGNMHGCLPPIYRSLSISQCN